MASSDWLNNRYQVLESLGRGGFGETFLAIDTHMPSQRKCVIKKLHPLVQAPQIPDWLKERFAREAAILEDLGENHPQIPKLYAYFTQGGEFYLVQEWIAGLTLAQAQAKRGNFPPEQVKTILLQLLPVLEYIHSRGIIHRDIKPENIILRSPDNLPILIDFGVVKETVATVVQSDSSSAYSIALGTPGYMACEQAAGRPVYSSDLYSLGLTAIFLLTGQSPQELNSDKQTGEILLPANSIPDDLAAIIERAIRFHPRDRFSSDRQMFLALQGSSLPVPLTQATLVVAPAAPTQLVSNKTSLGCWPWFFSLLLLLGAMVGGFFLGFRTFFPEPGPRPEPQPTPEPEIFQPLPSPSPSPSPTPRTRRPNPPTPSPEPSPEPTPEPTPEPIPEPSPEPSPEPTPSPESIPIPVETPEESIPIPVEPAPEETPSPSPEG